MSVREARQELIHELYEWQNAGGQTECVMDAIEGLIAAKLHEHGRHDGEHGRSVDAPPGGSPQGSRTGTALTVARARQIDVVAALSALRSIVQFAYEQGYHELGYDPVQDLEDALHDH
jgi:hypothetical protein